MTLLSWLIVLIPLVFVFWMAFHSRRYVRDVTDYLASGRVAGRYVISVGDVAAGLSVITLVAMAEKDYQTGIAIGFWNQLVTPISLFMGLFGYCVYRFRQTRCLSCGQFLELRYSRSFRIVACTIRTLAEMVTNAIGPAVAVRFFIYFIGLPHRFMFMGINLPTYGLLVALLLIMALALIWPAGRISLLITDCIQGILCYPIFVIFTVFVLMNVSWFGDMAPVMLDRPKGESFLNPMDISGLRDFNMFALVVSIMGTVLNRAAWIGNDTSTSAKTPHEQKMAGILGTWRNGFAGTMMLLVALFVITYMLGGRFANESRDVRVKLVGVVAEDVVRDPEKKWLAEPATDTLAKINASVAQIPPAKHEIGVDKPYSRTENPDTPYLTTVHETLKASAQPDKVGDANKKYQEFRSVYNQMMMPTMLGSMFNPVLMGLFALLMIMLLLTTDDSRIFNASSTIVQDVIVPFRTQSMDVKTHLRLLKATSLGVTIFFFVVSLFFAQLDFINMFTTIMCAVWLGAAGPIMIGGLYTRFGTTAGAWSALAIGSGIPTVGLFCQRNWADLVYPFLVRHGGVEPVSRFFDGVTRLTSPWVVWKMDAVKFPVNSVEIYFMAMVLGVIAYCVVSWMTLKEPFNLDRMLHRGLYADPNEPVPAKQHFSFRWLIQRIVGIDHQYTTGDKVIAWSVVCWSLGYHFGIMFIGVLVWNTYAPWTSHGWAIYFFISTIVAALLVGTVSTVWFMAGGIKDARALFRDLKARVANPLDDGMVEGHVSTVDRARFDEIEQSAVSKSRTHLESEDEDEPQLPKMTP